METNAPSEELPALYRAILDRVAEMEASGERAEAARLRSDATDARRYSQLADATDHAHGVWRSIGMPR